MHQCARITTIEGIGETKAGTASAVSPNVREHVVTSSDQDIRERMSGKLFRCGADNNIVAAVRATAKA
jgi:xanthine dehydrogenase YagT iron-sulfur-binding subunit